MFEQFKKAFYFPIASYFRFFAARRLRKWNPQIIVVTGSNGKTTLLHMLEAQLGDKAKVSHHANSAYGIPFDILDLHRKTMQVSEWFELFIKAPLQVSRPLPKEKIYIVEADADRPNEGKFLAELLKPDITLWVSTGRTHSMNFDALVSEGKFKTVEEAIAYEYGYFLKYSKNLALIDGDSDLEKGQLSRTKAQVRAITKKDFLTKYNVTNEGTELEIKNQKYTFQGLLPEEIYLSVALCRETVEFIGSTFDPKFTYFHLPPGRGTLLTGVKDTLLIDSTYNGNLGSMQATLSMFDAFPAKKKWAILGDMKELGKEEKEEHERLAEILNKMDLERVLLIGKLVGEYTLPLLRKEIISVAFRTAPEALDYLHKHIQGKEAILFKGSQSIYLEGLIEPLLKDKEDSAQLPRQDSFWQGKRKQLGFN
jgi:UDP-N-acetylmuramoyl-tripeptide--D-alanyl-D-alanine ligase